MKNNKASFLKTGKYLLILLIVNFLLGLIYCTISKKMSIVSYSDVLLILGGVYAGIGGLSYVGGENIRTANKMLISRDSNPRRTEESGSIDFNTVLLITGISTILISYIIGTFR